MVKIPVKTAKEQEKEAEIPIEDHDVSTENLTPREQEEEDRSVSEAEPDQQDAGASSPSKAPTVATEETEETQDQVTEAHTSSAATAEREEADEVLEEPDEVTALTKQLQAKEQELTEHYEARLRLQAEFNNFKKRKEKESADFRKYANESLLQDILPVIDDFDRAIAAAEQTHKLEDFLRGVEMIFSKFVDVLQKKGVKEIEAKPGQPFDPAIHEAVTQVETDEIEDGAIAAVFQKGYYLHDRVLRAPKVGVAKAKE